MLQAPRYLNPALHSPKQYRNHRLQTKTPEKEHVNMASQTECENCFQANVLIFTVIFRCLVNATALALLLDSFARKSDSVVAF